MKQVWFPGEGRHFTSVRCPVVSLLRSELVRSIQSLSPPGRYNHGSLLKQRSYKNLIRELKERRGDSTVSTA